MNGRGILIVGARAGLAVVGSVALYVLIYGGTGWLADAIGYNSAIGRAIGLINGALSFPAYGPFVVPFIAVALFLLLTKVAFKHGNAA